MVVCFLQEVYDVVSILCEVEAHALQPWLVLLDAAIQGTDVLGRPGSVADVRTAPFVSKMF